MIKVLLVYLAMALCISYITVKEDLLYKKIKNGFIPDPKDGDGDGIIQEGTKWERKK